MSIHIPNPDAIIEYVPSFAGNRKEENPCVVRLKYVSYKKVQRYTRMLAEANSTSKNALENQQAIQRCQFIENVVGISGFYAGDREVTDPEEFYDVAPPALVLEILEALEDPTKLDLDNVHENS